MSSGNFQLGIRLTATGSDEVGREAKQASGQIDLIGKSAAAASNAGSAMMNTLKGAVVSLGAALTVREFVGWMQEAINAGDEMKVFSQKTGVAVSEVAGLQLAFKQGGVEGDALTGALGKLSKQMVAGNDAFDALGVKTRNADGSLRTVKDVLYDVADATAKMGDGAAKSALLQEILGKTAADLIPTLNDGSKGLRDMADMADKLGLSMSGEAADAADKFNDTLELVGMGVQGVARQTMAQLLPTLNSLAGAFLETVTSGDRLRAISDSLAAALKLLFSAGVVIVEVFSTVGKTIGAAGAQLVAVMQGDFKGAMNAGKEWAKDIKTSWSDSAATISKAWSDSGDTTVAALAGVVKAQKVLGVQTAEQKKAHEQAAAAAQKYSDELDKLTFSMRAESAGLSGDFFAKWQKYNDLHKTGRISVAELEAAQARLLKQQPFMVDAVKEQNKFDEERLKVSGALVLAELKEADTIADLVKKQEAHNATIGKTTEQLAKLEAQKLDDALATAQQRLQDELKAPRDAAVLDALTLQVEELRKLKKLKEEGVIQQATVDTAKAAAAEWQKTSDSIGQGLTDSLYRAFESGKGFFSTLWDGIKNTFKTTVLKLLIQGPSGTGGIAGSLLSMIGLGSSTASAAGMSGGIGGMLGGLGGLAGIGASLGAFGTAAGYGVSALFGGTGLTALSGGASMVAAGSAASGLGMMAGVLGPIALGVGAIMAILKSDTSGTPHSGGTAYADRFGSGLTDGTDINFDTEKSYNSKVQASVLQTSKSVADILNAFSSVTGAGNFRVSTGFQDDTSKDGAWGGLAISKDGQKVLDWRDTQTSRWAPKEFADGEQGWKDYMSAIAASTRDAIGTIGLPEWAKATLAGAQTLEELAAAADSIKATEAAIKAVGAEFGPLGGVFGKLSGLSSDATLQLANFAGGLDQFVAKTRAYVDAYYSDGEKASLQASSIRAALDAAGFTGDLTTKDQFRALVDARAGDIDTEAGRKQLAALLDVATNFASLADYIEKNGGSLNELAGQAPQVTLLQGLQDKSAQSVDYQQQAVDGILTLDATFINVGGQITSGLQAVQASLEAGLAAVADATQSTVRQLQRWDDGGALMTTAAA